MFEIEGKDGGWVGAPFSFLLMWNRSAPSFLENRSRRDVGLGQAGKP